MKRKTFIKGLSIACSILERIELDNGVSINSALHGYLSTAIGCINNALHYSNQFIEND